MKISCSWCNKDAVWFIKDNNGFKNDYMCDSHYNSHARSPMAKGVKLKKTNCEKKEDKDE